ncbi:MAG: ATP synthase F1 subunit gamma [Firmicutes bacterium]|nr:ATP synthase F1 subunit gamma [Bacillota bacterium]
MATIHEIQSRIKSIRDTQKITNAMYLIASMKMRKAKGELDRTRPYFDMVSTEIKRVFRTAENVKSHYFYPPEGEKELNGTYAYLVITADKGLAGAYNMNVLKKAEEALNNHPDTKLYVVGEYGRQYFKRRGIPVERNFLYTAQNPSMTRAREICAALLNAYDAGEIEKIYILYTDLKNGIDMEAKSVRVLPFHRASFHTSTQEKKVNTPFEFFPSVEEVLDALIPSYVSGYIYSALVDSFCSEQSARMNAMSAANDNARSMIEELQGQYNRIRQSAITQEITEITAGSRAIRQGQ